MQADLRFSRSPVPQLAFFGSTTKMAIIYQFIQKSNKVMDSNMIIKPNRIRLYNSLVAGALTCSVWNEFLQNIHIHIKKLFHYTVNLMRY